jgi:hypothetical protein
MANWHCPYHSTNWSKSTGAAAAGYNPYRYLSIFRYFENNGKTMIAGAKFQLQELPVIILIKNT